MRNIGLTLIAALMAGLFTLPVFAEGRIKFSGNVGRAGIFVDGNYIGPVARFTVTETYRVAAGEHEITLRDPRYEDFKTTVTVEDGKTTKIKFKMTKLEPPKPPYARLRFGGGNAQSLISVAYGDTSAVYLNGQFWGYVDEFNNVGGGMVLPPGTYTVRVDSPIYGQINEKVTLEANRVTVIPLSW